MKTKILKNFGLRYSRFLGVVVIAIAITGIVLFVLEKNGVINLYTRQDLPGSQTAVFPVDSEGNRLPNTVDYGPPSDTDNFPVPAKNTENDNRNDYQNNLGVAITRTSKSTDGSTYYIRAIVTGTSEGTCTATLTSGDSVVVQAGTIGVVGGQTSCVGLDVPTSSLASSTKWNLQLSVVAPSGQTSSTSTEVIL